jgi:hypothetical protein
MEDRVPREIIPRELIFNLQIHGRPTVLAFNQLHVG